MNIKHSILVTVGISGSAWPILARASAAPTAGPAVYAAGVGMADFAEPFAGFCLVCGLALLLALCVGLLFLLAWRDHRGESRQAAKEAAAAGQTARMAGAESLLASGAAAH